MLLPNPIAVGQKISAAFLNAILAAIADAQPVAGTVTTSTPSALNTATPFTITFPTGRFDVPPVVQLQIYGSAPQFVAMVASVSTSVANCNLWQSSGGPSPRVVGWIATEDNT